MITAEAGFSLVLGFVYEEECVWYDTCAWWC